MNVNKATGPDRIAVHVLKDYLSPILSKKNFAFPINKANTRMLGRMCGDIIYYLLYYTTIDHATCSSKIIKKRVVWFGRV